MRQLSHFPPLVEIFYNHFGEILVTSAGENVKINTPRSNHCVKFVKKIHR